MVLLNIFALIFSLISFNAQGNGRTIELETVSQLPIIGFEKSDAKVNVIGIIGGKGIRNKGGKSQSFILRSKSYFNVNNVNL